MNARAPGSLLCLVLIAQLVTYSVTLAAGDIPAGKAIYERLCVSCHGLDGRGGRMAGMLPVPPRNLLDQTYMQSRSDQQLFEVISQGSAAVGLSSAMSGFGTQLTAPEIWDTIAYIRTLTAPGTAASAAETGLQGAKDASTELHIARLHLSIWPEYDDPRVLVMFRGEMAPPGAFPTRLVLPIPKGAEIIGAGMISERNELLLHPHQVLQGETHDRLELTLPVPHFFVEFYYNLSDTGTTKRFTYTTPSTYPIAWLEVDIQQPLLATQFTTDPPPMRQEQNEQGFTSHLFVYRDVGVGDAKSFTVSYVRTAAAPSVTRRQPASEVAAQPPTAGSPRLVTVLGILAGAAVAFGGSVWLWTGYQRRRKAPPSRQEPSSAPSLERAAGAQQAIGGANFCANCGAKLQPGYRFCPGCGSALRSA
jgi:mono/diheme cytochrome c family protein